MIVKLPACYDVSHHKEIFDFKVVNPRPVLFITKATEHISFVDDKFERFFSGMMEIEVIRGAYHFNRKAFNPYQQAEHFIKTISKMDILSTDFLILDVEELGTSAASMWAWFKTVKEVFPNNRQLLYSSVQYLNPIYMTAGERDFFRKIPTWPAGYPYYPDLFPSIPPGYTPDQLKYGKSVLWQYTAHGRVEGITTPYGFPTDVDLNWIEPEFYSTLGSNVGVTTMANFTGKCISGDNKVWDRVGGRVIGSVRSGDNITGDTESTVAGVAYLHLTSPISGWSKKQWFSITYVTEPPPPPPPPPPPSDEYILHVKDGVTRKFILE